MHQAPGPEAAISERDQTRRARCPLWGGLQVQSHLCIALRRPNLRATILASVPWFLQDLGTYGIGIFTPTILARTIGHEIEAAHNVSALIARDILAAQGAALLDVLLIIGILAAVFLADRVGRIRLQIMGFIGCAIGLGMAALSL